MRLMLAVNIPDVEKLRCETWRALLKRGVVGEASIVSGLGTSHGITLPGHGPWPLLRSGARLRNSSRDPSFTKCLLLVLGACHLSAFGVFACITSPQA